MEPKLFKADLDLDFIRTGGREVKGGGEREKGRSRKENKGEMVFSKRPVNQSFLSTTVS